MTDYTELVKALRIRSGYLCPGDICDRCEAIHFLCSDKVMHDAAAAIEALQAEKKKTVTQIFGEEQMAWEGRCKDLMKHISDLQAEVERLKADVDAAYRH